MIILWYDKKFTWDHHSLGENDFPVPECAYVGLCPRGSLAREQHSPRGSCAFARKQDHKGDGHILDTLLTIYWLNFYLFYNTWDLVFPWYPSGLMLHTSLASAPMFCLSYIVENWLVFYHPPQLSILQIFTFRSFEQLASGRVWPLYLWYWQLPFLGISQIVFWFSNPSLRLSPWWL